MSVYFIAGSGTDIGKTYVTARLAAQLRAQGTPVLALKPVVSGTPAMEDPGFAASDTAQLLRALGRQVTPDAVQACSPWRFKAPLSPDMAAAAEGRSLSLASVLSWCRDQIGRAGDGAVVLIEGVGGVMSPMTGDALNTDVVRALGCETVLVAGTYLGALSHALTAVEALRACGAPIRAVILNESAASGVGFEATLSTLRRFAAGAAPVVPLRRDAAQVDLDLSAPRGLQDQRR